MKSKLVLISIFTILTILSCTPNYPPVNNKSKVIKLGNTKFTMKEVPGAEANEMVIGFKKTYDKKINPFWMAETELTSEVWTEVYIWATGDKNLNNIIDNDETQGMYTFANSGKVDNYDPHKLDWDITFNPSDDNNKKIPIRFINWNDAIVFCNAITEYYNELQPESRLTAVYNSNGSPIRNSRNRYFKILNNVEPDSTATGFRLATEQEWLCAASYLNGKKWNHARSVSGDYSGRVDRPSGGVTPPEFLIAKILFGDIFVKYSSRYGEYAWYKLNSDSGNGPEVKQVALKKPNTLGIYDMSGNVYEHIWSGISNVDINNIKRAVLGGSFAHSSSEISIDTRSVGYSNYIGRLSGIRLARNYK